MPAYPACGCPARRCRDLLTSQRQRQVRSVLLCGNEWKRRNGRTAKLLRQERETGIEPATSRVERRSGPEPIPSSGPSTFINFRGQEAHSCQLGKLTFSTASQM